MSQNKSSIAIIGGTGKEGCAIAARFARAGFRTIIGSRSSEKAINAAYNLNTQLNIITAEGSTNRDATAKADIVLLAVPYDGMKPILEDIKPVTSGKIVINIASSLDAEKKSRARINPAGSIAQEIQNFLGPEAKVVDAFQNISPEQLEKFDEKIETITYRVICECANNTIKHAEASKIYIHMYFLTKCYTPTIYQYSLSLFYLRDLLFSGGFAYVLLFSKWPLAFQ